MPPRGLIDSILNTTGITAISEVALIVHSSMCPGGLLSLAITIHRSPKFPKWGVLRFAGSGMSNVTKGI